MKNPLRPVLFAVFAVVPASFAACGAPAAKLSAGKSGDLSHVLGQRTRPDEQQLASCGEGTLEAEGERWLRRGPYLQRVTASSADVVFTSAGEAEVIVDVTRPDGALVASETARVDTSARPAGAWQGVASFEGLEPNTLYCYALRGLSQRAGFRTAPPAGSSEPVRVLAFGDSGTGTSYQYAVMEQMLTVPFDLMVHTGDVAYDDGTLSQFEKGFFRVYAPLLRSFSVFAASGNHDYRTNDARPFRDVFLLPENGGDDGRERWFSFDWGHVHFVALDTERTGPAQAAWLDADLAASDQPWKIVFWHKPPFSSGEHGSDGKAREWFHPLMAKHGVPLVLNGHEHNYERTKPQDGVTYVVTGGGGRGTRPVGSSGFTAFSEDVLHFVQLEIHQDELLLHAIDGTGREFDSLRVSRAP